MTNSLKPMKFSLAGITLDYQFALSVRNSLQIFSLINNVILDVEDKF